MLRLLGHRATIAVLCVLACLLFVGFRVFTDPEESADTFTGHLESVPTHVASTSDSSKATRDSGDGGDEQYSGLQISEGDFGFFSGRIVVHNDSSSFQDVLVSVAIYDGTENVGSLTGMGTIKPKSSSGVRLTGGDNYASWTDTHIEVLGLE